ncbi:riboflavin biosynthesis protein RibBA [Spirochaetia bacterium]|nr:riboflavin biosynthesis protein RibBA [Spirochaetia bacterium]
MKAIFADIEEAVEDIRQGKMLVVTDDEDRENEGDLIMAAEKVSPEAVNFMAIYGKGLICQAITCARAGELDLPPMTTENTSANTTAFTVSVDAACTSTGISAFDRAATIRALVDPVTKSADLLKPGHIFPLIARDGGVLARDGHTEAAADLARLAGLTPSGILCEILAADGRMARLPQLEVFAKQHGLKLITVASLIRWRREHEGDVKTEGALPKPAVPAVTDLPVRTDLLIRRLAESRLPTQAGNFRMILYDNPECPRQPHLALVSEAPFKAEDALVRVHSECFTGEVLRSGRCDCGDQLTESLRRVAAEGGVVIYLRQEGRGIGLTEKIKAYALQDTGLDTVDANIRLGHGPDERDYAAAAAILRDLGIPGIRLMTNNPAKVEALNAAGIRINARVPVEVRPGKENRKYLAAKKVRFGHKLEYV